MIASIEDLNAIFDFQIQRLMENGGKEAVNLRSKTWLETKLKNFEGAALLKQLEKNTVYFIEATGSTNRATAQYLTRGEPNLGSSDEINSFIVYVGKERPLLTTTNSVLSFIRSKDHRRPAQFSNWNWADVQAVRNGSDQYKYWVRLMLLCRGFQVATQMADAYLKTVLQMPHMAVSCSGLFEKDVFYVLDDKINWWANWCIGNVNLVFPTIAERLVNDTFAEETNTWRSVARDNIAILNKSERKGNRWWPF